MRAKLARRKSKSISCCTHAHTRRHRVLKSRCRNALNYAQACQAAHLSSAGLRQTILCKSSCLRRLLAYRLLQASCTPHTHTRTLDQRVNTAQTHAHPHKCLHSSGMCAQQMSWAGLRQTLMERSQWQRWVDAEWDPNLVWSKSMCKDGIRHK